MPVTIDFHTHIFPDNIAGKAVPLLEKEGHIKAFLNGTQDDLLRSMEKSGVTRSVVCSIATKPAQFEAIMTFSDSIRSEKLVPFPSIHPAAPNALKQIRIIKEEGFQGIKMHPFYQDFFINDENLLPIFEEINNQGLILLMHTGYDIAFPEIRRADPAGILKTLQRFPDLKLVASHFGAWKLWDEVKETMLGKNIYMDLSYALEFLGQKEAKGMIEKHPQDYLLFASDSPWSDQQESMALIKRLSLDKNLEEKILGINAMRLLEL
jgi:hypothetical protein